SPHPSPTRRSSDLAAVWSKLDQHKSKLSQKKTAPKPEQVDSLNLDDAVTTPPPAKPEQSAGVMSERYVNSELTKCTARLRQLETDGYNGEPWHNTTRDVAF